MKAVLKMEILKLGTLNPNSSQRRIVYDKEYIAPCIQAAAGEGGGQVPMVIVNGKEICNWWISGTSKMER